MSEEGVARLIALGEGYTTEFKRSMPANQAAGHTACGRCRDGEGQAGGRNRQTWEGTKLAPSRDFA